MLELSNVTREYHLGDTTVRALQGVDLRVDDGDFLTISGPSGSGKSTLLQIVGCLDRQTAGRVLLDGRDLASLSDGARTRLRLTTFGFVFQRFHLVSVLTAIENVAVPMEMLGIGASARFDRARTLLEQVGMGDRLHFLPARLSGGQRQRVAIARAVVNHPRYVLADEPTGALHSEDKIGIISLFRELNRAGHTIVVVTHDPEMARVADHQVEIRDGYIKEVRP